MTVDCAPLLWLVMEIFWHTEYFIVVTEESVDEHIWGNLQWT